MKVGCGALSPHSPQMNPSMMIPRFLFWVVTLPLTVGVLYVIRSVNQVATLFVVVVAQTALEFAVWKKQIERRTKRSHIP